MGSLTLEIKRFLQNKNTVTVLGVILAIFVLYFVYTMRVKRAVNPIEVPYANEQILSTTKITESMISIRLVPPKMLKGDPILSKNDIIGKYVNPDAVIPKGSLFYRRNVVESENIAPSSVLDIARTEQPYYLPVDIYTTYGNAIVPRNYVDIWVTAIDKEAIVGKLFSNVKILAVQNENGYDVFQNMDENRVPKTVIFAMPEEYRQLLDATRKLQAAGSYNITIRLVPTNESLQDNPGDIMVASEELKNWINQNVQYVENS